MKHSSDYVQSLDGLRGFSILLVMVYHTNAPFLEGGSIGVDIFFVLSGYLITNTILKEKTKTGHLSYRNFYIRRALRLTPAFITMLTLFSLISFFLLSSEQSSSNITESLIALFYLSNWFRALSIDSMNYLGHTWSLSAEEQFYLIWPLALITLLKLKNWIRLSLTILVIFVALFLRFYLLESGSPPERIYNGFDTRIDCLLIGCLTSLALSNAPFQAFLIRKTTHKYLTVLAHVSIATILILATSTRWHSEWSIKYGYITTETCATILIIALVTQKSTRFLSIFNNPILVQIGILSYGLYIWHYPVFRTMFENGWRGREVLLYGFPISFTIATLSFNYIERPFLKLKKQFATK